MTGIARQSLSRNHNDWQRRKLVSRLSGCYCIEDKAELQEEAEL
jgi:CRP/FNR family transcriptional regulator, cyclic AMP receptor protein